MIGIRYGCFVVLKKLPNQGSHQYWECKCDCGKVVGVRAGRLLLSPSHCKSCSPRNHNIKHGLFNHPLHITWVMMKQRCENPNAAGYGNYGGRGVRVCDRWQDFGLFLEDVGLPPSDKHTVDRFPDKDGNYELSNFRWATPKEQLRNTRSNRFLEFNGVSKTIAEWSEITGLNHGTIWRRIENGWPIEKALTKKVKEKI